MFNKKISININANTYKKDSKNFSKGLTIKPKSLKRFILTAVVGISFAASFSATYVLAGQAKDYSSQSVSETRLSEEILDESIEILYTDSLKDTFSDIIDEERLAAEQNAFIESIDELSKNYSNPYDLKKDLEKMASDLKIDAQTLELAFENIDKSFSTPYLPPVTGLITSKFGYRTDPFSGGRAFHTGLDIQNTFDSDICASAAGTVIFAEYYGGYGNFVKIDHGNGFITCYGHLNNILCEEGDSVSAGTVIGTMGNSGQVTGTHLHYEVLADEEYKDPLNYITDMSELSSS